MGRTPPAPSPRHLLLVGLCILAAAGCARREEPPLPQPPTAPQPAPTPSRATSAADFVSLAASLDLFLVRSSELALTRSQDPRMREFARGEIEAHRGTAAQLSLSGRRLNLLPSATLRPEEQSAMDQLLQHPDFDRLYRRQQVSMHEVAVDLHGNYAASGTSPTLRPVAAAALQIYRRHLEQLRSMR